MTSIPNRLESTYALLVRSQERPRNGFETAIYTLLFASILVAVSQFGRQVTTLPSAVNKSAALVEQAEARPSAS